MEDLKGLHPDLMNKRSATRGQSGVGPFEHWKTDNPQIQSWFRGEASDDKDLVISRDYIRRGLRLREASWAGLELGPRSEQ